MNPGCGSGEFAATSEAPGSRSARKQTNRPLADRPAPAETLNLKPETFALPCESGEFAATMAARQVAYHRARFSKAGER
jgi:hypothetical protein